ncbi:MAG: NGG1p interacting factor NIF3 [Clostridia bacterium]|nr:NGG1p interacting factor NIF3 [Clostridia bacterium]MDD4798395.1 NGG1p interacting factor NIF3 [Clostridia bacterium]
MKLYDIYKLAVENAIDNDPRGRAYAEKTLAKNQKAYDKLSDDDKELFDTEALFNPYADSRILYGDPDAEINKLICGIDMETPELLLANELNKQGAAIDLVLAHHPEGRPLAELAEVMGLQTDLLSLYGVRANLAQAIMEERQTEIQRSVGVGNTMRAVDTARLLGLNYACFHTLCDNLVNKFVGDYLAQKAPETLDDVVKALLEIPEYRQSAKQGVPPRIYCGSGSSCAGKIMVDFTGGTGGHKDNYSYLAEQGISTIIVMHAGVEVIKNSKEKYINIVCAGHIASDSIGLNLLLDKLEERGVEIAAASGLIRIKR